MDDEIRRQNRRSTTTLRLYDGPLSGLDLETQRDILRMASAGVNPLLIAKEVNVKYSVATTLIERGVVQPHQITPRRCRGCGAKQVCEPCMTCELRERTKKGNMR